MLLGGNVDEFGEVPPTLSVLRNRQPEIGSATAAKFPAPRLHPGPKAGFLERLVDLSHKFVDHHLGRTSWCHQACPDTGDNVRIAEF